MADPIAASTAVRSPDESGRSVLQFLGPSTGGIRAHVGELARRLIARGWAIDVVGPAHVMDGVGPQDGVVEVPVTWNPLLVGRARHQLARHVGRSDLIHVHGLKAALVAVTLRHRPPMVLTIHNLVVGTRHGTSARVLHRVETFLIRRAEHVIVISDEIGQRLRGTLTGDRCSFVLPVAPPRSVSADRATVRRQYGIDEQAPLVVIVARHHPQKDLGMFLRAVALVRESVPSVRALMVGDGPDRRAIENERHLLDLDEVVTIAGHRPNPVDEMNAGDVVALSSRWEGSPLVVAECLSLGRPLVTTSVGTVTRHLTDGIDARVVAVGDARAFAAAITDLLHDRPAAARIGAAGREIARRAFDADHLVDGIEAVYRQVLG